jgi:sulfoxide reductase heme-binding subunit YedZ
MNQKRVVIALKVVLWLAALAPGVWLVAGLFRGWLGANPIEKLTHVTGMTTLVLLLVTLSVTPLRRLTGWNSVIRLRRPLGLFAFFYAASHFSIWFVFDMVFDPQRMLADIIERPFITVGFTAFVILMPLAATSTKGWIRRLGKKWTKLHRGVYVAAALGVVHFYWLVKADTRLPILLGVCLAVLLALRSPPAVAALGRKKGAGRPARASTTTAST